MGVKKVFKVLLVSKGIRVRKVIKAKKVRKARKVRKVTMVLGSLYNHSKQAKDIIMAIMYLQNHPTAPVKITIPCGSPKKTLSQKQNHTRTQQVVIGSNSKRHVVKKENKASVVCVGLQAQLENKEKRVLEACKVCKVQQVCKVCKVQVALMEKMAKKAIREIREIKEIRVLAVLLVKKVTKVQKDQKVIKVRKGI